VKHASAKACARVLFRGQRRDRSRRVRGTPGQSAQLLGQAPLAVGQPVVQARQAARRLLARLCPGVLGWVGSFRPPCQIGNTRSSQRIAGFRSLQLLEQHLNLLGKEEWEIIHFRRVRKIRWLQWPGPPAVMRDWVVETAPGAGGMPATKSGAVPVPPPERQADAPSADELRAEAEERRDSMLSREETLRPMGGADAEEDAATESTEEIDDLEDDEDLRHFWKRSVRTCAGTCAGRAWPWRRLSREEIRADRGGLDEALKECGFTLPASAKDEPVYLEYDGDLYWLNLNHRGSSGSTRAKNRGRSSGRRRVIALLRSAAGGKAG